MKLHNVEQGTPEWQAFRAGVFTASRSGDLMKKGKHGAPSMSRANLITALAVERVTKATEPTFLNDAMVRGQDLEEEAANTYALETGQAVEVVGFCQLEDDTGLPLQIGTSPDRFVGTDGVVEIKCPAAAAKHLNAIRHGSHAKEYRWQCVHHLMVTGRKWCDVVSFDPRFPPRSQLAIVRMERDEEAISQLRDAIEAAEAEIQEIVRELTEGKAAA